MMMTNHTNDVDHMQEFGMNTERAVDALLSDNIPPALANVDRCVIASVSNLSE